jgi:hypothetical protein
MIVLTEDAEQLPPSASARDIIAATNAAKLAGCQIFHLSGVSQNPLLQLWHRIANIPERVRVG